MAKKPRPEDLLDWIGLTDAPDWRLARPYGRLIGFVLSSVLIFVPILVVCALIAAFVVVLETAHQVWTGAGGPNLGAGALIAAILGAPFVIWGTVIKHRQLGFQKEGHITDRISKAVEQLGAEKVVERIGRPVTIFTGMPERINYPEEAAAKLANRPRTRLAKREWEQTWDHQDDGVEEGYRQTVTTWPAERTVIQWQGDAIDLEEHEEIGAEGAWQVFKETAPNIEVRIGGLLSLERISQDSVSYDHGRDHVRVMEILCAYIRNNAPAESAQETREGPRPSSIEVEHLYDVHWHSLAPEIWASAEPRTDVALALRIIGRRSARQQAIEKSATEFGPEGFRPDLSRSCLQKADLSESNFDRCNFFESRLESAHLNDASFCDSNLGGASLDFCSAFRAQFDRSRLDSAKFCGALLDNASFNDAQFGGFTFFLEAQLIGTRFKFNFGQGAVNRVFFKHPMFRGTELSGSLISTALGMQYSPSEKSNPHLNPLRIRNAQLSAPTFEMLIPERIFADGSVILVGRTRPEHWRDEVLDDKSYDDAFESFASELKNRSSRTIKA